MTEFFLNSHSQIFASLIPNSSMLCLNRLQIPVAISVFLLTWLHSSAYPHFSASRHPLNTLHRFSKNPFIKPVVLKRYYFRGRFGANSADGGLFVQRALTYNRFPNSRPFLKNVDALRVSHYSFVRRFAYSHGRVYLNYRARVFIILSTFQLTKQPPSSLNTTITGVPMSWRRVGMVSTTSRQQEVSSIGDRNNSLVLSAYGVAFEIPVPKSNIVRVPHPHAINIDSELVRQYVLAFTNEKRVAFQRPRLPQPFKDHVTNKRVNPSKLSVRPNMQCPEWLHNTYVTRSRNLKEASQFQEPKYWRSWHPMIDPIYWCYFDHEHGSYPGHNYRPLFGYTALKTIDKLGNPQDESHEGFKIYSIPQSNNRLVIITLHIHLAKARRFLARRHTLIFAVLSSVYNGKIEMELHMKADFGPGLVYMRDGGRQAIEKTQERIRLKVRSTRYHSGRQFNVLNIDENFPKSVNTSFAFKGQLVNGPIAVSNGLYEQWNGGLNSCSGPNKEYHDLFHFDVRDPSTAMRFQSGTHKDEELQPLNGYSLKRILIIRNRDMIISTKFCRKRTLVKRKKDGSFFTNTLFRKAGDIPSRSQVKQFIKRGFENVVIKMGVLRAGDPWSGWYGADARPGFQNLEGAILKSKN